MKKYVQSKLSRQLVLVVTIACSVILLSIGVILPKSLLPVYEKNLYNYLKQPLELVSDDIEENPISNEIAYIYMYEDVISVSENLGKIVRFADVYKLTNYFTEKYGKFIYKAHIYYYYTSDSNSVKRVALTNDSYIRQAREDALHSVFPIVFITMLVVSLMLVIWSSLVVRRIEKLKKKIDHIDDDTYNHQVEDSELDEIYSLEQAIEDMRLTLKNQEEYRNQMYQNISHDFKTPLAVIKSYIEAVEDQVEDANKALPIIQEQTLKLENKVHSLLYLNKLDYIRERNLIQMEEIDIKNILNSSVEKFKYYNKNLKFKITIVGNSKFYGTVDSWETVIDNILNNFIRYAEKEIRVTLRKNQLVFYNDGPNISSDLLEGIFIPFRKGIKGEFGLGLSIVKKTLSYMHYDIQVKNHTKNGVSFIITKEKDVR